MCGINGITCNDTELVGRMNTVTAHRGPDGVGVYADGQVTFGHNRLAIIDTSERGAQPMESADSSLVISYNGMLYNYPELRRELSNYPYKGESDTEVILAAYEKWGIDCLKRFNGIFAFALWDKRQNTLFLVRDQLGIKPLYYSELEGNVVFSSEIKALLEAGISRTLDREAFSRYLRLSDVPGPATTFSSVKKIPPAHYASIKEGEITLTRYWSLDLAATEHKSASAWKRDIRDTLDAAVNRQLISDRPVGVFLSGGIDSSAVLASVIRAKGTARTYTTRFEVDSEYDEEKFNRDALLARKTSELFGTEHTEVTIRSSDIISLLEDTTWYLDEPSGNATALSQLLIAREASKDVAVVLGGDGGDELFGGYERYRLSRLVDLYQRAPRFVRSALESMRPDLQRLETPAGIERFAQFHFVKQPEIDHVLTEAFRADYATPFFKERFFSQSDASFLTVLMDADLQLLADGSFLRTDKLSMAAGIEARVPILDREMVELAARIPAEEKASLFETKKLFKDAVRDRLPSYLFAEPKRGWFAPSGMWLQQPDMHAYTKEVLSPSYYAATKDVFDWEGIATLLQDHYDHTKHSRSLIWTLLSFQIWARRFGVSV